MTVKTIFKQLDYLENLHCNKKSKGIIQNKVGEINYFKNFLILFFLLVGFFIIVNLITSDENIPEEPPKPLRKVPSRKVPDQIAENLKDLKEKPAELKPVTKPVPKPKPVPLPKPVPKPLPKPKPKPKPIEPPKVVKEKKLKDVIKEYKTKSPYEFCWFREKETNDDSCYFF